MSWAWLLKWVFDIDIEHCPHGDGALKSIAAIQDPPVIVRVLTHLGLPLGVGSRRCGDLLASLRSDPWGDLAR